MPRILLAATHNIPAVILTPIPGPQNAAPAPGGPMTAAMIPPKMSPKPMKKIARIT
ncbi:hypothetical protein GCM10027417_11980 [Glutamicibacter endophyticus]